MSTAENASPRGEPPDLRSPDDGARPIRLWFAVSLAGLAGWVDAIAFVHWKDVFVSFMSGNSTIFASSLAMGAWRTALPVGAVVLGFVIGVMIGEWIARGGRQPHHARHALVLFAESAFLLAAAGADATIGTAWLPAILLAMALGVQNATIYQLGKVTIAVTYVTGTLVQIGRGIADALSGLGPWHAPLPYVALWCGLIFGAALGALAAIQNATAAIIAASLVALAFSVGTGWASYRSHRAAR